MLLQNHPASAPHPTHSQLGPLREKTQLKDAGRPVQAALSSQITALAPRKATADWPTNHRVSSVADGLKSLTSKTFVWVRE